VPFVVGVDSSTSACKVQVHDLETGQVLATGRSPHPTTQPPRSEQHPSDWERAFNRACAEAGVGAPYEPVAMSIAGQQHGMVVLGEDGEVLRPAKLWNDTESASDSDALLDALEGGKAGWADAIGSVPVASFTVTKLHWLARCEPDVLARTRSVLLPHDWLNFTLTGQMTTDRGDASGTGYWSPREARYRFDLLGLVDHSLDWSSMVPRVLSPTEAAGVWRGHDAIVGPGTGDNMAVSLGLGLHPGDLGLSFGTSATAFTVSNVPSNDSTGAVAGFADATGRYLPLVCTLNATKVFASLADIVGATQVEFGELALEAEPGASGLVLVPHFDGERSPNRPAATGTLRGLRNDVTRAHIARAAMEGVVCNLLAGTDALQSPGTDRRVFLVGGAARGRALPQIVADLIESPVHVVTEEAVATGAAIQAAATYLGCDFDSLAASWRVAPESVIEPAAGVDAKEIRERYAEAVSADST